MTLLSKGFSRRKFLASSLLALPASGIVLSDLSAAKAAELAAPDLNEYKPIFLTADEWAFVVAACDRFIPADGRGPGALETNVPIFIDQQLHGELGHDIYLQGPFHTDAAPEFGYQIPFTPQQIYQRGIPVVNKYTQQKFQKNFSELSNADKDAVLTAVQKNEVNFSDFGESELKGSAFFSELLSDTKNGYLADPMYGGNKGMKAWIAIGFPGARASYLEWVKQHNIPYPLGPVSVKGLRA